MRLSTKLAALLLVVAGCGSTQTASSSGDVPATETAVSTLPLPPLGATDGPVVRYPQNPTGVTAQPMATISGDLQLDGACLYVVSDRGDRYPIVWPAGTAWDETNNSVIMPTGEVLVVGGPVDGGGGYFYVAEVEGLVGTDAAGAVAACVDNTHGEIAIINSVDRP